MLIYTMENEMSFVCHVVQQHGCSHIIENDESLNERT
jgi:hypothetical protein